MYNLRIIERVRKSEKESFQKVTENFELGSSYSKIVKDESDEFNELTKEWSDEDKVDVESIICGQNDTLYFIYTNNINRNHSYFIMSDSGQTFERL